MNRNSIWFVLLAVACAANVDPDDATNSDGGGATSGSGATGGGGKAGNAGGSGSGGIAIATGGSLSGSPGSAGISSVGGKAGMGGGGASAKGGTGGDAGGSSGGKSGSGGAPSGGSAGSSSGGSGRIDQKEITAQYQAVETGTAAPVQHIYGQVRLVNMGGGNAYLKDTKARYYFTNELAPTVPQFELQLHQLQAPNLTMDMACQATLVKMPTPTADADTYIEFTFPSDPQVLDNGKTGIIQFRIFDPMPTQPKFDQSNDYSFNPKTVSTDKITIYYKGNIIWGNEPVP